MKVMKKLLALLLTLGAAITATAQTKGIKIAYIDMEYILDKVPSYAETKANWSNVPLSGSRNWMLKRMK
jgi:Skp family chaperone for outer membrane proteins